jgi:hypothetical protein
MTHDRLDIRSWTMSRAGLCPVEPRWIGSNSLLLHAGRDISHAPWWALRPVRRVHR